MPIIYLTKAIRVRLLDMSAFFRDARLKIERAKKHIADLQVAIVAQENTYTVTIEHHPDTGAQSLVHEFPDFEEALFELSLIVGDAIHNLHSALDFAWYGTISRHLPDKISPSTKFPVRDSRQQLEAALHGIEVDTRCKPLFDCLVSVIQPYKGGHNEVIWTLHDLDISDKHLLLLELDPLGHIGGIAIRDSNGETSRGSSMPAKGIEGRYIVDFESDIQVENEGKLSVTVTLPEAGIFKPVPVVSLLESFSNFVLYTVKLLENI
jgi:hypothetical protein